MKKVYPLQEGSFFSHNEIKLARDM